MTALNETYNFLIFSCMHGKAILRGWGVFVALGFFFAFKWL